MTKTNAECEMGNFISPPALRILVTQPNSIPAYPTTRLVSPVTSAVVA
jgi:hypothetical protein